MKDVLPKLLEYSENRFIEAVRYAEANDVRLDLDDLLQLLRETHNEVIQVLEKIEDAKNE